MNQSLIYLKKILPILSIISISHLANAEPNTESWNWQIKTGLLNQDYYEVDNNQLTADGVLNSETGNIPAISLSVMNTMDNVQIGKTDWIPYGNFDIRYASGETNYDGYLQIGSILTPYNAKSDNRVLQTNFTLGATKVITDSIVITPNIGISHHKWERDLEQYTEKFHHTAVLVGANADWQPSERFPLTLQITGQVGKIVDSEIDVPTFGLNQNIGNAGIWHFGVNGNYKLTNNLSLNAGFSQKNWEYESSDIDNGYLYPDSESEQTVWEVGLGYQF